MIRRTQILAVVNNLIWIITILILMYLRDDLFLSLSLMNIVFCLFIAVIFFVVSDSSRIENSMHIEEYKKRIQECQRELQQKSEIINQIKCECNANKNKNLQELITLRDIMYALKTYIKLNALKSAIGNVRSNNKEKAENKITETANIVDEITQDAIFYQFQFFAEIDILKDEYHKILKDYKSKDRNDDSVS